MDANTDSTTHQEHGTTESDVNTSPRGNGSIYQCEVILKVLGILVGLLIVLLVVVTTGWVWTCWTTNKRGGKRIYSGEQVR